MGGKQGVLPGNFAAGVFLRIIAPKGSAQWNSLCRTIVINCFPPHAENS